MKLQGIEDGIVAARAEFASLLIGIVQSLGTPWGLFRYYCVIVKLVLSLLAVVVLMLQTQTIDALDAAAAVGDQTGLSGARFSMMLHGSGGAIVLLIGKILSVYKPRRTTALGF